MADIRDFELLKTDEPGESPRRGRMGIWLAAIVGVAAVFAGYFFIARTPAPAPAAVTSKAAPPPATPPRPLGGEPERVAVPPLDESDPVVRELVRKITSHPAAMAWLATRGLIRNFTVVVSNVAEGPTPARQLSVLRPTGPFRTVEQGGVPVIDPRSYERYDRIAAAAASIDPGGAARTYATLKPRIEEAYGELGMPPASFDRALERAIVALLQVPIVDGPVRVAPKGGVAYQFADPRLEQLTAAQKQLLRTGPQNVRTIQGALRQIAGALGISADRLPQERSLRGAGKP